MGGKKKKEAAEKGAGQRNIQETSPSFNTSGNAEQVKHSK